MNKFLSPNTCTGKRSVKVLLKIVGNTDSWYFIVFYSVFYSKFTFDEQWMNKTSKDSTFGVFFLSFENTLFPKSELRNSECGSSAAVYHKTFHLQTEHAQKWKLHVICGTCNTCSCCTHAEISLPGYSYSMMSSNKLFFNETLFYALSFQSKIGIDF